LPLDYVAHFAIFHFRHLRHYACFHVILLSFSIFLSLLRLLYISSFFAFHYAAFSYHFISLAGLLFHCHLLITLLPISFIISC